MAAEHDSGRAARLTGSLTVDEQMTDREFQLFQSLILEEAGISLENGKKAFLVRRLSRLLGQNGMSSFTDYYRRLTAEDGAEERGRLFDAITTNETRFFRDPAQFEYISEELAPALEEDCRKSRRPRHIRVWSASCATGEEAYSLAMVLSLALPANWLIRVLASDLDRSVLAHAQRGLYNQEKLPQIPSEYHKRCLLRGRDENEGSFCIAPEIRVLVDFKHVNLIKPPYAINSLFDVIFCRNTLMYFDEATRARVVDELVKNLKPNGLLFLGRAESLAGRHCELEPGPSAIFRRRASTGADVESTMTLLLNNSTRAKTQ